MTQPLHLRAGPLALDFDPSAGWLRRVRLGGREVVRAVYPAVRDRFWNTLPNAVSNVAVEAHGGGFRLTFDAACRRGAIDFTFHGEIVGTPDATVTYRFGGVARSTFQRNRIGLCVLHPVAGCAGEVCDVEHPDGRTERRRFPAEISPHQPFHDVRALTHEVAPEVRLEVRFDGDVFETEDQRNWTDASFKTYSTPLALPFPVEVTPGTVVRQTVTLRLSGTEALPLPAALPEPVVTLGPLELPRLPRFGLGVADRPLTAGEIERLRALRPDHLRVDLAPADPATADRLRAAAAQAAAVGAGLEAAVLLGDDPAADLERLAGIVRAIRPPVRSWLLCRDRTGVAGAAELALGRRYLGEACRARFGVGTNLYFTELNRTRPALGDADFIAFSVNPQVHAFDDESLVETLDGQTDVVANARLLAAGRGVAVTPITLRPRFNPNGADGPDPLAAPDPRQYAPFAAAWTLGSLRRLAGAGAESATYFETAGPRGLLDAENLSPVYHLFAGLADAAGWTVNVCQCNRPLVVEGLVFRSADRWCALVANLTPRPQAVSLLFAAAPCRARLLGEATVKQGPLNDGRLQLPPYSVARVEGAGL